MLKKASLILLLAVTPVLALAAVNQVNINTASKQQLMKGLDDITPKQADAILNYRKEHGAFVSLHDLTFAKGIGRDFILPNYDKMTVGKVTAADRK